MYFLSNPGARGDMFRSWLVRELVVLGTFFSDRPTRRLLWHGGVVTSFFEAPKDAKEGACFSPSFFQKT